MHGHQNALHRQNGRRSKQTGDLYRLQLRNPMLKQRQSPRVSKRESDRSRRLDLRYGDKLFCLHQAFSSLKERLRIKDGHPLHFFLLIKRLKFAELIEISQIDMKIINGCNGK